MGAPFQGRCPASEVNDGGCPEKPDHLKLPDGGTEFHWQGHHVEARRGKLLIFPAGVSQIHRGRVSQEHTKTIATGWMNTGTLAAYLQRLAA